MLFLRQVCFCVLTFSVLVTSQYYTPCPNVFSYESDGVNIYGKIVLTPNGQLTTLVLKVNLTVAARLLSNYAGRIDPEDGNHLLQKYNRGIPVSYRVHFPVTSPVPKITAITVNGNTVCYGPGDVPGPSQYVTTLNLQHMSYLQGAQPVHGSFQNHQPNNPVLLPVGQLGGYEGTQVYMINNIEGVPSWNNDYSPLLIVNKTSQRPQLDFNQRPTRPSYDNTYNTNNPGTIQGHNHNQYDQGIHGQNHNQYDQGIHGQNHNQYDQNSYSPTYDIDIRDGIYDVTTKRPFKPYPQYTTEAPRPVFQHPIQRRPDPPAQSNNECGVVAGGNDNVPLIKDGKSYARGDVPWLVAIYKNDGGTLTFICGGTLVSNRHVITAAHCMHRRSELTSIKDFVIKIGVYNLNDWSDEITVTRTVISAAIHEGFNATTLENDILVFTFNKRVEFNTYIRPACLWSGSTELGRVVGASGVVAGWGDQGVSSSGRRGDPALVRVPIVSTAVCRASKPHFHWLTSSTTLCAGDRNGAGPCKGDSGGGLYLLDNAKWRLRGVVSISLRPENGDNSCNLDEYIVFTDTAQYLTWIRSVMSENYYD